MLYFIIFVLIITLVPIILNFILLLIEFELYERKDWIMLTDVEQQDPRFFKTESYWETDTDGIKRQYFKCIKIAEPRPTIKDFWEDVKKEHSMTVIFFPGISLLYSISLVLYIIVAKPLRSAMHGLFNKIKDIKI